MYFKHSEGSDKTDSDRTLDTSKVVNKQDENKMTQLTDISIASTNYLQATSLRAQQLQNVLKSNRSVCESPKLDESVNLVLGDSNTLRVHFKDPDVYNVSVSGCTAAGIDTVLDRSVARVQNKNVKRIVMHLGTNDVTKNKDDPNQVILEVSSAVSNIKRQFPEAEIAVSNILQRRGRSPAISLMNKHQDQSMRICKSCQGRKKVYSF